MTDFEQGSDALAKEARESADSALRDLEGSGVPAADDTLKYLQTRPLGWALIAIAEELRFLGHDMRSPLRHK